MEETDHFMHKLMSRVCDSAIIMSQLAKNFKKKIHNSILKNINESFWVYRVSQKSGQKF